MNKMWLKESYCIIYFQSILCLIVSVNCTELVYISTKINSSSHLAVFRQLSLIQCTNRCKERVSCEHINYKARSHVCYMIGAISGSGSIRHVDGSGCLSSSKWYWDMTDYNGCVSCNQGQACIETNSKCVTEECSPPPVYPNTTIKGNIYSLSERVVYTCDINTCMIFRSQCMPNGSWSYITAACNDSDSSPWTVNSTGNSMMTQSTSTTTTTTTLPSTTTTSTTTSTTTPPTTTSTTTTTTPPSTTSTTSTTTTPPSTTSTTSTTTTPPSTTSTTTTTTTPPSTTSTTTTTTTPPSTTSTTSTTTTPPSTTSTTSTTTTPPSTTSTTTTTTTPPTTTSTTTTTTTPPSTTSTTSTTTTPPSTTSTTTTTTPPSTTTTSTTTTTTPPSTTTTSTTTTTTSTTTTTPALTQSSWFMCGTSWFKYDISLVTWYEAKDLCITHGGHLAYLKDTSIMSCIQTNYYASFSGRKDFWIGANDSETEGSFKWLDGGNIVATNALWNADEPNDMNGDEDCVSFYTKSFLWNDADCTTNRCVMCQQH